MWLTRDTTTFVPDVVQYSKLSGSGLILTSGTARIEAPTASLGAFSPYSHPSDTQLNADGTTAIARTEPTNPAFDLSVYLGELRQEGLPNLPGDAVRDKVNLARSSGSEYLNIEFGWSPLIRGLRDFAKTVEDSDEIIRNYQEHANAPLKRSYEWPVQSDSRFDLSSFSMTPAVDFFRDGGAFQYTFQKKWFEAEYIYFLPTGGAVNDKIRRYGSYARKLLGVDLSPEVLWNLSPWSWAADWFGNVGDVMHNISALGTDGLVIRRGYIMCHTLHDKVYNGTVKGAHQVKTRRIESKTRLPATPFGFGVSFDSLTAKQVAILAALGLSRW